MTEHDWTYFIRKIYVKSSKEDLFSMWVDPENITKFWLSDAKYFSSQDNSPSSSLPKAGDLYEWTFSSGSKMRGKVLEIEDNRRFKFTFGKTYQDSDENVHVTILIDGDENESWVELLQENIGTDEFGKVHYYISCQLGWMNALMNLKSVVEQNYDLREKEKIRVLETVGVSTPRQGSAFQN